MVSPRLLWLPVLCLVVLAGCDNGGPCARVRCSSHQVCNPQSGACQVDPSYDGGVVHPVDAGTDAGADAGTIVDGGATCSPACAVGFCNLTTLECVACLTDADCSCPRPICELTSHSCITAPDAGFPVPELGESCAEAKAIPFPLCSNLTQFHVDLAPLIDDEAGTCSSQPGLGHDAVYLIELDATYDLKVTATASLNSAAQPVAYLRLSPCESANELVCVDALGGPSTFRATSLPAGEYALVIDSFDLGSSGPVDVTVEKLPPTAPANDTCATPVFASTDGGTVTVDLSLYGDQLTGTCNTSAPDSREAVWRVALEAASDFHAVATAVTADAGTDTVVYLRRDVCTTGAEVSCVDAAVSGPESLTAKNLSPGTYFLVVEGYGAAGSGPVNLTTWATAPVPPPNNDSCLAPRPIVFQNGATSVTFTVDTSDATDDDHGSCSDTSLGGKELVYQLSLPIDRTVTITGQRTDGGTADPVLYLRADACDALNGFELACSDAPQPAAVETISQSLLAGTYYLFVDSYSDLSAGPTVVTVNLAP